jgi:thiamine pyrophosphokinase
VSSHHVIREKQEPALIIANGEACSTELLGNLLEWSPFVVVLDSAINRVIDLGIKADVLLGDFDRNLVDLEAIEATQFPIEIVHTPDQDKTDLEKAIDFLIERGFPAANVVWATGRRMDHTFANVTNMVRYKNIIKIVLLDDHSTIFCLPEKFEKWYEAGTILSLLPVGTVTGISSNNLVYELNNDTLEIGYRVGNSNEVAQDGLVKITHSKGNLLLMECRD